MVSLSISHITIGSTRHCTRCPFVCMVASSHNHTQTANACNAHVPGVRLDSEHTGKMTASHTQFTANAICILDAVPAEELQTGRNLHEELRDLSPPESTLIKSNRFQCHNLTEINDALNVIINLSQHNSLMPIVHYEGHGTSDGLFLPSAETLEYEALTEKLRTINIATSNNLVAVFAGCETAYCLTKTKIDRPCPYFFLLAPEGAVKSSDTDCFLEFYRSLLVAGKLSIALDKFNDSLPSSKYLSIFSEGLFALAAEGYYKKHFDAEGPYEHYCHTIANSERILSCLLYTSPSPRDATLSRMPSSA